MCCDVFSEQDVMRSVVGKLGGYKVVAHVGSTTSHVVCGDNRRTLNVLHAIARGCWLLSKEWVSSVLSWPRCFVPC